MSFSELWQYENQAIENGYTRVCGCDEAGRGPLCGPVVAAAVTPSEAPAVPIERETPVAALMPSAIAVAPWSA